MKSWLFYFLAGNSDFSTILLKKITPGVKKSADPEHSRLTLFTRLKQNHGNAMQPRKQRKGKELGEKRINPHHQGKSVNQVRLFPPPLKE